MKTKYVFVIEDDSFPPVGMERCYIFDNFEDAKSFYTEKGYTLELYANDTMFYISNEVNVNWHGNIHKGLYY